MIYLQCYQKLGFYPNLIIIIIIIGFLCLKIVSLAYVLGFSSSVIYSHKSNTFSRIFFMVSCWRCWQHWICYFDMSACTIIIITLQSILRQRVYCNHFGDFLSVHMSVCVSCLWHYRYRFQVCNSFYHYIFM